MENHMIKPAYYLKQLPCSSHGIIKSTVLLQRGVITIARFGFRKIPRCAITPLYKPGIIGTVKVLYNWDNAVKCLPNLLPMAWPHYSVSD